MVTKNTKDTIIINLQYGSNKLTRDEAEELLFKLCKKAAKIIPDELEIMSGIESFEYIQR